jgi:hypothetical protein
LKDDRDVIVQGSVDGAKNVTATTVEIK